jgi:hypothetical protein
MGKVALYCKAWLERQQKVGKKYMESKQKSQSGYTSECLKKLPLDSWLSDTDRYISQNQL